MSKQAKPLPEYARPAADPAPYYKLDVWCPRSACFRDAKRGYLTAEAARAAAKRPGRYRVSHVTAAGREDCEPFVVRGAGKAADVAARVRGRLAGRVPAGAFGGGQP